MKCMEDEMVRRISVPMKSQRARDRVSEEIAKEEVCKFFAPNGTSDIVRENKRTIISLEAINPKGNLMADFRALFIRTKVWRSGDYRSKLVQLASSIIEMTVTPDLALILQVIVMRNNILDDSKPDLQ